MTDIFEMCQELKTIYPEDIEQITAEEERVKKLLALKEYAQLPETQELIGLCRKDVVFARTRLATERALTPEQRDELWLLVEARQWFLRMVARDYNSELSQVARQLEADLAR